MLYGESKLKLEKYLLDPIQRNYDITILRPPWFYGPFMPDRQYRFYRMIKDGKFLLVGKGNNLRSKVHLLNLTKAILLVASNEKSKGEIYWVADEKPYSQLEIISIVRDVLKNRFGINVKNRNIKDPLFFGDLCEITDKLLQKIGFYNQSFHVFGELNKTIACNISKIKEHLNYEPIFDFKTGLEQSLIHENSYKKSKMNILVTGGSGYFGEILLSKILEKGFNCRNFDLNSLEASHLKNDVDTIIGDIREKDKLNKALKGVDVVFHNVAQVPVAKDKQLFYEVNYKGTSNLLDLMVKNGVHKIVYTSSSAIFGVPKNNPVTENTKPNPFEAYGKA